jgi:hypothetical protein
MDDDARRQSVKAYFDCLAEKDMSRVPWAKDATLRTPLNPAGSEGVLIRGRQAILEFFTSVLPVVRGLKFLHYYWGDGGGVAGQAEIASRTARRYMRSTHFALKREIIEQQNGSVQGAPEAR